MVDANLSVNVTQKGAEEATASVDGLGRSMADLTAEEARQEAVLAEHSSLLANLTEAQTEAAQSVAAMADAAQSGGAKYTAAIKEAQLAVAALEEAQMAVAASGGPISPAAVSQLAAFDAAVAAASLSMQKGAVSTRQFSEEANLMRGNVGGLARALAGAAGDTDSFIGKLAAVALPAGAALGVLALIPLVIDKISKAWLSATETIGGLVSGLDESTSAVDKHGKALGVLTDAYQKAMDVQADQSRLLYAIAAGFAANTTSMNDNLAAYKLQQAAMRGWVIDSADMVAASKQFGLKLPEDFDHVRLSGQAFFNDYQNQTKVSAAAARAFAEENQTRLGEIIDRYLELGKTVPPELQKIADSIGLVSKAEADNAKNRDLENKYVETINTIKGKLVELSEQLDINARSYTDHATKVEADRVASIAAIDATTNKTLTDLQLQVTQTEAAHAARTISDDQYFSTIDSLIGKENTARQDAYAAEQKINDDSAKSQTELSNKYILEQQKINDQRTKDLEALTKEQAGLDKLNAAMDTQARALQATTPLFQTSVEVQQILADLQTPLADKTTVAGVAMGRLADLLKSGSVNASDMTEEVSNLVTQMNALTQAAIAAATAVRGVTGDAGIGGTGQADSTTD
jgi:hypothetical protein